MQAQKVIYIDRNKEQPTMTSLATCIERHAAKQLQQAEAYAWLTQHGLPDSTAGAVVRGPLHRVYRRIVHLNREARYNLGSYLVTVGNKIKDHARR